jgi:hypothetical protein
MSAIRESKAEPVELITDPDEKAPERPRMEFANLTPR